MLNVFTKTKPWMVASLLAATSVFGQTKTNDNQDRCRPKPCEPMPQMQMLPAYNAPARIDVRGSWDLYAGASFTYWQARQENMEFAVAISSPVAALFPPTAAGLVGTTTTGTIVAHNFKYKPGFKVMAGINFDHDGWDGYAEYTWFKSNTMTSTNGPAATNANPFVGVSSINAFPSMTPISGTAFSTAKQNWKLKMQFLDTALARTYYVGTKLTFRSIFGARFAWFTQTREQTYTSNATTLLTNNAGALGGTGTLGLKQNFTSWGAGPMAGLNTNWVFGEGFRMIGNGSVDLLYTRVEASNSKFSFTNTAGTEYTVMAFPEARPDFLMPHMNLEMGFGWGSYFDCNNWHVDFLATYGFQVFWNANLFRQFNDSLAPFNSNMPNGNLYVHGLTATMRIDF